MTRNTEDKDNNRNERRNINNRNRRPRNYRQTPKRYNQSRSMILLKSSVFALFVVLVTLVAAFLIFKNNETRLTSFAESQKCKNNALKITAEIDEITSSNNAVYILTKSNNNKQQLIKLDSRCLEEKTRVTISK